MLAGVHLILNSQDPEADRAFLRDTLGFEHVDVGHGWLIFALPPAEIAVHPAESPSCDLYFLCADLPAVLARLAARSVDASPITEARWGSLVEVTLPGGGRVGIYQPKHPLAPGMPALSSG